MDHTPRQRVLMLLDLGSGVTRPVDPHDGVLTADDRSAHRGDGVFETFLVDALGVHQRERHFARFARSAAALDLPEPDREVWDRALDETIRAHQTAFRSAEEFWVRCTLSRGPDASPAPRGWLLTDLIPAAYTEQRETGISATSVDRGFPSRIGQQAPWLLLGAKTLSYAVNLAMMRVADARGVDEALQFTHDGLALEFPTSNLVIARGDELLTPDPEIGLLHGTTQQAIFDAARAAGWRTSYADLRLEDVLAADGAWAVSSIRRAVPVTTLDGEPITRLPDVDAAVQAFARHG